MRSSSRGPQVIGSIAGVIVVEAVPSTGASRSTIPSARSPCTASAGCLACWRSACSPTASTAPDGTSPPRATAASPLFYGNAYQLVAQLIGIAVICTVMFGLAFAFFKIQNAITKGGIRPSAEDEIAGLDLPEMGVPAYHDETGHPDEIDTGSLDALTGASS
ncbi:MAG: hypothetical protein R2699_13280 [Acidimicrobiales bacterium]